MPDRRVRTLRTVAACAGFLLVTSVLAAAFVPATGEPVDEPEGLWIATDQALLRIALEGEAVHRIGLTPGADHAAASVRANRLFSARHRRLHALRLDSSLQAAPGDSRSVAPLAIDQLAVAGG